MSVVVSVEPDSYPVTLDQVKSHLCISTTDDDNYIDTILIPSATTWAENETQRALESRTLIEKINAFKDGHCLRFPPLISVSSITYIDPDGNSQTLATSVYDVDSSSLPGQINLAYNQSWPQVRQQKDAVTITYVAGYAKTPKPIISAMLLYIGHLYENRESTVVGTTAIELPFGIKNLLTFYKFKNF